LVSKPLKQTLRLVCGDLKAGRGGRKDGEGCKQTACPSSFALALGGAGTLGLWAGLLVPRGGGGGSLGPWDVVPVLQLCLWAGLQVAEISGGLGMEAHTGTSFIHIIYPV
jgi:hypothetical protein